MLRQLTANRAPRAARVLCEECRVDVRTNTTSSSGVVEEAKGEEPAPVRMSRPVRCLGEYHATGERHRHIVSRVSAFAQIAGWGAAQKPPKGKGKSGASTSRVGSGSSTLLPRIAQGGAQGAPRAEVTRAATETDTEPVQSAPAGTTLGPSTNPSPLYNPHRLPRHRSPLSGQSGLLRR
jgi:hypothetical protein